MELACDSSIQLHTIRVSSSAYLDLVELFFILDCIQFHSLIFPPFLSCEDIEDQQPDTTHLTMERSSNLAVLNALCTILYVQFDGVVRGLV
jgi:hypothetical protein